MSQSNITKDKPTEIMGPYGIITMETLPDPNITRWVIRRKAEVILAVRGGLLTREEAIARYRLTEEEFEDWLSKIDNFGLKGLKTSKTRYYRMHKKN